MSHDFWASATDPARAADWTEVFGDNRVPIVSPLAIVAMLPDSGISLVYLLAMDQLTGDQFEALVAFTAARFHADPDFVRTELRVQGMPIPSDGVTVTVLNPQKWFDVSEGEQLWRPIPRTQLWRHSQSFWRHMHARMGRSPL